MAFSFGWALPRRLGDGGAESGSVSAFVTPVSRAARYVFVALFGVLWCVIAVLIARGKDRLDLQTFTLLVGIGGFVAARLWGRGRTAAIEIAFVASGFAAGFAVVVRGDITTGFVTLVGYTSACALLAWGAGVLAEDSEQPKPPPPAVAPATSAEVSAIVGEAEYRLAHTSRRSGWITAVVVAAVAAVVASIITRNRT